MKILFESDRECTIDGVGLLEPGVPVEINSETFQTYHRVKPLNSNLPSFIHKVVETEPAVEGGE